MLLLLRGKVPCDGDLAGTRGINMILPSPAAVQAVLGTEGGQRLPWELCVCPAPPLCRTHRGLPLWCVTDRLVQASPGMQALRGLLAQSLWGTSQVLPQAQRVAAPSRGQVL